MKNTPDEKQLEQLLETDPPAPSGRIDSRLAAAPWTPRAMTRRRISTALSFTVLALAVLIAATPQGRAFANGVLHFFTRAGSDILPAPTMPTMRWVEQTPGAAAPTLTLLPPEQPAFHAQCGDFSDPHCSIAQIRSMVDFAVQELDSLPAGVYFTGATGGPGDVWLFYKSADNSRGISLHEAPWTGGPEQVNWQVGASAVVESVQIGGITGEYVKGSFHMMAGDTEVVWDPDFPTQTLHWVDEGVFYEMQAFDMQAFDASSQMDRAAFIALAASLTTEPVAAALTPMPTPTPDADISDPYAVWTLTPAEAGALAGFTVHEPARLPEILAFRGASYDADHHLVEIFYADTYAWAQGGQDGLTLSQQRIPPSDCEICGFVVGTLDQVSDHFRYTVVGENAVIETVQIGEVTGQYVVGAWYDGDNTGMKWHNDGYMKVLRWQAGGTAYELTFWGMDLEKADMIAIAESMSK